MKILEVRSGIRKEVVIELAGRDDYKVLVRKRFSFVWRTAKDIATVYKLQIKGERIF